MKKYLVRTKGLSAEVFATSHKDAVSKLGNILGKKDTIQYPEIQPLIEKARKLGLVYHGQEQGDWVFDFGKASENSLDILINEIKEVNPKFEVFLKRGKLHITDSWEDDVLATYNEEQLQKELEGKKVNKDAKTLWLVNVGQDHPIKKVFAKSKGSAKAYFESKGFTVKAVEKSLNTPMNSNWIEHADASDVEKGDEYYVIASEDIGSYWFGEGGRRDLVADISRAKKFKTYEEADRYSRSAGTGSVQKHIEDKLVESPSEEALKENIATEVKAGKPVEQAVAIAKNVQKENKGDSDIADTPIKYFIYNKKEGKYLAPGRLSGKLYYVNKEDRKLFTAEEIKEIEPILSTEDKIYKINFREGSSGIEGKDSIEEVQAEYEELSLLLKKVENEIDRQENNPNFNLKPLIAELDQLQQKIYKLKAKYGTELKDAGDLFIVNADDQVWVFSNYKEAVEHAKKVGKKFNTASNVFERINGQTVLRYTNRDSKYDARTTTRNRLYERDVYEGIEWGTPIGSVLFVEKDGKYKAEIDGLFGEHITTPYSTPADVVSRVNKLISKHVNGG